MVGAKKTEGAKNLEDVVIFLVFLDGRWKWQPFHHVCGRGQCCC